MEAFSHPGFFSLQSFKKLDDQWVVKAIDAKDRDTKSRTRFELKAFAHDLDLSPSFFPREWLKSVSFLIIDFTCNRSKPTQFFELIQLARL